MNKSFFQNIVGIDIFLERNKTRAYVGNLTRENRNGKLWFHLKYNSQYINSKFAISLGPELPLTHQDYRSQILFTAFKDRIPSRDNPAYPEYCKMMGISEYEQDPIVLLATIGKKGPSSFIFEPIFKEQFSADDLKLYRKELGLTVREFSALFDVSYSHLQRIESKKFPGHEILKRIEIYKKYPKILLNEIERHGGVLHADKKHKLIAFLKTNIQKFKNHKIKNELVNSLKTNGTENAKHNLPTKPKASHH